MVCLTSLVYYFEGMCWELSGRDCVIEDKC